MTLTTLVPKSDAAVRYFVSESAETVMRRVFDALDAQPVTAEAGDLSQHFADVMHDAIATSEQDLTLAEVLHHAKAYVILEAFDPYVANERDGLAIALRQARYAQANLTAVMQGNLAGVAADNALALRLNLKAIEDALAAVVPTPGQ